MTLAQRAALVGLSRYQGESDAGFQARIEKAEALKSKAGQAMALNATCQITNNGELLLYGIIGDWWDGLDATTIANELLARNSNNSDPLTVRIHSDGGSVMDGLAIVNALKATGRATHAIVDGLAASMAAYIAMSTDTLAIPDNAYLMIHKVRGGVYATADELRRTADIFDQFNDTYARTVSAKTGKPVADVLALMDAETWIDGRTAVAEGYADELLNPIKAVAQLDIRDKSTTPVALRDLMTLAASTASNAATQPVRGNDMNLEARAKAVGLKRRDNETDAELKLRVEAAEAANAQAMADAKAKADAEAKAAADAAAAEAKAKADAELAAKAAAGDAEASATRAVAAERQRASDIRALCAQHGMDDATRDSMVDSGISIAEARNKVLDALAKRTGGQMPGGHVSVGNHMDAMRPAIAEALTHRLNPAAQLSDAGRNFRGMSMVETCRAILEQQGRSTRGMNASEVAQAVLTTSDLPNIMGDVAHKIAMDVYQSQPQEWKQFCRQENFPDFRDVNHVQMGGAIAFDEVDEAGEFKYGSLVDSGEKVKAKTYGSKLMLSRQLIVNDDLNAFASLARMIGFKAATKENALAWGLITGNPTMGDGKALFHSSHKNIGTTGALSETTLSEMRALIRKQKDIGGGAPLGLRPKFLIVPTSLETAAQKLLSAVLASATTDVNVFANSLQLIVSDQLDDNSTTAFYTAADPGFISSIVWGYLNGSQGLNLQQEIKFGEGVLYTGFMDFGVGAVDYRGLAKNAGA